MFGPRNYAKISQLHQYQSQVHQRLQNYMMHQRSLQGYTIDQRGPHSYSINQRVHGCTTYQQNLTKHHTQKYSWGSMAQQQQDYSKVPKVQFDDYHDETNGVAHDDTNAKPASHYNREYNNNLICPNVVSDAKTVENDNCKDSLFPHGDPLPYDYLSDWDQRPECPRPKWTHPENPSWQPPIKSRTGEYSGTELILVREAAELLEKNVLCNCRQHDCSDSSSVKLDSTFDF